jgi:hypothetical protein
VVDHLIRSLEEYQRYAKRASRMRMVPSR